MNEREQLIADLGKVKTNGLLSMKSVAILDRAIAALSEQGEAVCKHRITDARNQVVASGYVCIDCGALFAAAEHSPPY